MPSQKPISDPKISSVTVRVNDLDLWESAWTDCHNRHDHIGATPPGMWYGSLEDYDPAWDSDRDDHKLGCCGEARPRGKRIRVVVSLRWGTLSLFMTTSRQFTHGS